MTVQTMRVDIPFAAFFAASLALALAGNAAGCLASAGLVAGLRISGLEFAAVGLAAACFLLGRNVVRMPIRALVVVLPALGVGTFWYVRNFVALGNPLGLVRVAIGGVTLVPGPFESSTVARTTLLAVSDASDPAHRQVIGHALRGQLGLPFILLLGGSLPLLSRRGPHTRTRFVVVGLFLAACALYTTSPFSGSLHIGGTSLAPAVDQNLRYALPALGLLGALGAVGASMVIGDLPVTLAMTLVFAGAAGHRTLIASLLIGGFAAGRRARPRRPQRYETLRPVRKRLAAGRGIVLRASQPRCGAGAGLRARARAYHCSASASNGRRTRPPSSQLSAVWAAVHEHRPLRAARGPDREDWIQTLRTHGVSVVALGPLPPGQLHPPEVGWLSDPSGPFIRIAGQDATRETVLYRLRKPVAP